MKIGIVLYSQTGNTLGVAEKLMSALTAKGHTVDLLKLQTVGEAQPGKPTQFESLPDITPYDAYVFAAPVQAFSLCLPMKDYLKTLPALDDKKAACFVTKHLKSPILGGNSAIKAMRKGLESKGATVGENAIISWKDETLREAQIKAAIQALSHAF